MLGNSVFKLYTVKNLSSTIPSLLDKISRVENLTTQLSTTNVSENIRKIKELIELARDAANRVSPPIFESLSHHHTEHISILLFSFLLFIWIK